MSLSTAGFDVPQAGDGQAVLDLVRCERPDCVVLDVAMPLVPGHEVCRAVRADPLLSSCAVLLLTAAADPGQEVAGYSAGADGHLVSPPLHASSWLASAR